MPLLCTWAGSRPVRAPLAPLRRHLPPGKGGRALRSRRPEPWIRATFAVAAIAASLLAAAGTARAARVVDVRIGVHPGYARVVLETDAPAAHELVAIPEAIPGEVVVRIAATAAARELAARAPDAPSVALEPQADGSTLARIRAPGPVRIETQVLSAPPRIVLDLRRAVAALPDPTDAGPEPTRAPEPEPTPEPIAPPAPEPAPVVTPDSVERDAPPVPGVAETSPLVAEPVVAPAPVPPEPEALPPVTAPPPASIALESRSLATGIALGIGIALFASAIVRGRRVEAAPAPAPIETAEPEPRPATPSEPPLAGPEPATEPAAAPLLPDREMDLVLDFLRMHQRLDERVAGLAARLDELAARQDELERSTAAQSAEIAAQRVAIARLQRGAPPRRSEPVVNGRR